MHHPTSMKGGQMYRSFHSIITPLAPKKRIPWITKRAIKIPDPFNEKYFTKIIFGVPLPQKADDKPCILVILRNSYQSLIMRFENTEKLLSVFNLGSEDWKELWLAYLEAQAKVSELELLEEAKRANSLLLSLS